MKKILFVLLIVSIVIPLTNTFAEHSRKNDAEIKLAWLPPWSPDINVWKIQRYGSHRKSKEKEYCKKCEKETYVAEPKISGETSRCWECGTPYFELEDAY